MDIAESIYTITSNAHFDRDWGLRDQIRRAAVSIPSNIAEGFERNSDGGFNRFLLIAKGSCGELRTQLLLAQRIGYVSEAQILPLIQNILSVAAMLAGLSRILKNRILNPKK